MENQEEADRRVPVLLSVPARLHFLSCEPLLGPVEVERYMHDEGCPRAPCTCEEPYERHVGWVIAGGESGPGARPMHPDWARSLRDQCALAGVPFHFKQWGEWAPPRALPAMWSRTREQLQPWGHAGVSYRVGAKAAGHTLDGAEHMEVPA